MSRFLHTISESEKKTILEQYGLLKEDNVPAGYKDITNWLINTPEGQFYIPDGEYKVSGMGYFGTIMTTDGKETGYGIEVASGVRGGVQESLLKEGVLPENITIKNNGMGMAYKMSISKIYLNESILNSSGLRKK